MTDTDDDAWRQAMYGADEETTDQSPSEPTQTLAERDGRTQAVKVGFHSYIVPTASHVQILEDRIADLTRRLIVQERRVRELSTRHNNLLRSVTRDIASVNRDLSTKVTYRGWDQ